MRFSDCPSCHTPLALYSGCALIHVEQARLFPRGNALRVDADLAGLGLSAVNSASKGTS
jgi:hypothetical protein